MFRFTIRDVLWLTVVVCCLVAWQLERMRAMKNAANSEELRLKLSSAEARLKPYDEAKKQLEEYFKKPRAGQDLRFFPPPPGSM